MVKEFLSQRGVGFEERDVSRNQAYAQELVRTTRQMGVPVTVSGSQIVVGFDRPRLEQLIAQIQTEQRPSFGASIADAGRISAQQGSGITQGAYIGAIKPGSVASTIGLAAGDIITKLNSRNIGSAADLEHELAGLGKGSRIMVVFLRGGSTKAVEGVL